MHALTRMNHALQRRSFVKVIAGLENRNPAHVMQIVDAATAAGVHAVDVCADPAIVRAVKARTDLVVFASAIAPEALVAAADAGADVLELGNFDAMYARGEEPTAEDILGWTRAIKAAVGDRAPLCVTISGRLPLEVQLDLATQLQAAGADLIQAEGMLGVSPVTDVASAIAAIAQALANAAAIRERVELPVFVAGGITAENAAFAVGAGACGVGIGRAVSSAADLNAMTTVARRARIALEAATSAHAGLAALA